MRLVTILILTLLILVGCGTRRDQAPASSGNNEAATAALVQPSIVPPGPSVHTPVIAATPRATELEPAGPRLRYLWPLTLLPEVSIDPARSLATTEAFTLTLIVQRGVPRTITITGGTSIAAPAEGGSAIEVRGVRGLLYEERGTTRLRWIEAGSPYQISGDVGSRPLLVLASGLEALTRDAWLQRLAHAAEQ
ncbi:MAG: hypothetical protein OHK0015_42940 [Chloroflexi bacterium OHK40]